MVDVSTLNKFNRGVVSVDASTRQDLDTIGEGSALKMENFIPLETGGMVKRPGFRWLSDQIAGSVLIDHPEYNIIARESPVSGLHHLQLYAVGANEYTYPLPGNVYSLSAADFTFTIPVSTTLVATTDGMAGSNTDGRTYPMAHITDTNVYTNKLQHIKLLRLEIKIGAVRVILKNNNGDVIFDDTLAVGEHLINIASLTFGSTFPNLGDIELRFTTLSICQVENIAGWDGVSFDHWKWIDVPGIPFDGFEYTVEGKNIVIWNKKVKQVWVVDIDNARMSVGQFVTSNGLWGPLNTTSNRVYPAYYNGYQHLYADSSAFTADDEGKLIRIFAQGVKRRLIAASVDIWTDTVDVNGKGSERDVAIEVNLYTNTGTVTLQRSIDNGDTWQDAGNYTATPAAPYNDGYDNIPVKYRIGIRADTTINVTNSPGIVATIYNAADIDYGIGLITQVVDDKSILVRVTRTFPTLNKSAQWQIGGIPSEIDTIAFYQGRLWVMNNNQIAASVAGQYDNFDIEIEDETAAIDRAFVNSLRGVVNWSVIVGDQLLVGTSNEVVGIRGSKGGLISKLNIATVRYSSPGVNPLRPVSMNGSVIYLDVFGTSVYVASYDESSGEVALDKLNTLSQSILSGVTLKKMVLERSPTTRLHILTDMGLVSCLIDQREKVIGWYVSTPPTGATLAGMTINNGSLRAVTVDGVLCEMVNPENATAPSIDLYLTDSGGFGSLSVPATMQGHTVRIYTIDSGTGAVTGFHSEIPNAPAIIDNAQLPTGSFAYGLAFDAEYQSIPFYSLDVRTRLKRLGLIARDVIISGISIQAGYASIMESLPVMGFQPGLDDHDQLVERYSRQDMSIEGVLDSDNLLLVQSQHNGALLLINLEII